MIQIHVLYNSLTKKREIKENGNVYPLMECLTKDTAKEKGRIKAKKLSAEFIVHKKDGTIEYRNSYGNDPFPPHG